MVETIVIILAIIAFAGGLGLAAVHNARNREAARSARRRPDPRAMPATQTADVEAKAGRDPAARL